MSSVVVLPFSDFSPGHDLEYFGDRLAEEIIGALSRVPNLRVVARTSAFAFKGTARDVREIGKQLDVGGVIEGSVQRSGDQIRITVQLNRVSDGTHLWSRKYDRQFRDIFALQNEISQAIANELRANPHPQPAPTEAYRLYEEGRYFFNQFQPPQSNLKAIERYQQAIQLDPNFSLAYAGLSEAYAYLAENMVQAPREVMPKAKAAAEKAVALDPESAQAHTALAAVKLDYDWDRAGAAQELQRALQINPGSAWAQHWYSHSLEAQGRFDEATSQFRSSLALDPLSVPLHWDLGDELIGTRQYDEALKLLAKASELFPKVPYLLLETAVSHYGKGDVKSAHDVVEGMRAMGAEVTGDPHFIAFLGLAAVHEGQRKEGLDALERLEQLRKQRYVEPAPVLALCAILHDEKRQGLWRKRITEERSTLYLYQPMFERFWAGMLNPQTSERAATN